ncbi:sugar ABC transporter permease [Paenibacillus nasutitermitis]|uniref:Sugar ABC transporter permease n=2 Tax=Paenibacillus nasutitermitis TaxID=1652958 RepID=A0A917DMR9_9BACL|nr:sugar ABC transporter permease [Paenibacillus nasutitermitis]
MHKMKWIRELPLHVMILPAFIIVFIYSYIPMFGLIIAFQNFTPVNGFLGSKYVGLDNFKYILQFPDIYQVLWNTVNIALMKIVGNLIVPVIIALLLNELIRPFHKRTIQTIVYLPNFLSWVIVSGLIIDILSPSEGIVNKALQFVGIQEVFFLGNQTWFPFIMVITDIWKNFGFGTVIFLAALTGIDPTLYESSIVDGANRWKQTIHITLPGIKPVIILMTVLSLGNILNAGFEQIFNLYNPMVYATGDIIDTLVYRLGIVDAQYSPATAVGLFKSVISFIMIAVSYKLADKFANYRIF